MATTQSLIALIKLGVVAFVISGLYWHDKVSPWKRWLYWFVAFATAAIGCAYLAVFAAARIEMTVEWDFLNYWLAGRIAAEGLPIYEAASYLHHPLPFGPSKAFFDEVIFVGTMYTPPAVLLFLPLGFFGYREAFILWFIVQAVVLAIVTVLLKREFFRDGTGGQHLTAWLAVICLVAYFPPVKETVYAAQVNFIMAMLFMLVWRYRGQVVAGVWIGLGMCIKPYFGILVLWLLLCYRFGAIVLASVTVALAFGSAALVLGADDVTTYFLDNPVARAPAHLYTQDVNQSALAVLRRATGAEQWTGSPVLYAPYIAFALFVTGMTAWSVRRSVDDRWALVACAALGLLLAPQSLHHYSAVLLPAIVFMAATTATTWLGVFAVIALFSVAFIEGGEFWLNLGVWVVAASYPWSSDAFTGVRLASNFTSLAEGVTQRLRQTVSNNGTDTSGSA